MFSLIKRISSVFTRPVKPSLPTQAPASPAKSHDPKPIVRAEGKTRPVHKSTSDAELRLLQLLEDLRTRETELKKRLRFFQDKESYLQTKEQTLTHREEVLRQKEQETEELRQKRNLELEKVAQMDRKRAEEIIMDQTEKRLATWLAKKIDEVKEAIRSQEIELSKEILLDAMKHAVTDYTGEYTVSTISLGNEDLKGKIIGREGRNIRAFEKATGVEIELDEGTDIRISSFDPVRREIAKIALAKLVKDGRIQPVRIEEVVAQTKTQMDQILLEEGKKICQEVGVFHLPTDIIKYIGKFKFRFSYGQNLAVHTVEETKIGVALARELNADVKIVRLACLLHDIGKVITDEEGTHVQLGADLLKRFKFPQSVIDCVEEHHEDRPFSSYESAIAWIADAASGSRPGARYEAHEEYVKRLTNIEDVARSFKGVSDVAAYQAGREVRVLVDPEEVSDDQLKILTQNIAEKLDEEAKWAGQIKVVAIREKRASTTAIPQRH